MVEVAEAAGTETVATTVESVAAAHLQHSRLDLAATRKCTRVCSRQQEPEAALGAVEAAMARKTVPVVVAERRRPSRVAVAVITVVPPVLVAVEQVEAVDRVPLAAVGPPLETSLLAAAVAVVARPGAEVVAVDPLR